MAKEIILRASLVSPTVTQGASRMILETFGGFYATDGQGGYVFTNGNREIVPAIAWHIATAAKDSARFEFVSRFAKSYCEAGGQESIYFRDIDGESCLVFANGSFAPIE